MELREHVALGPLTTLGVGGAARYFVRATTEAEILEALGWAGNNGIPVRVLGGGSNLVVSDAGFDGLVLAVWLRGLSFSSPSGDAELRVMAGEPWDSAVGQAVARGLSGLEGLSGIPGSAGATPIQNVGAYGQEVAETIVSVRVVDRSLRSALEFSAPECRFAYRDSFFKSEAPERYVVTEVRFALSERQPAQVRYPDLQRELEQRGIAAPTLAQLRECVLAVRGAKSMLLDPNDPNGRSCGSFFLNPIVTAELAEHVRRVAGPVSVPTYPQPDGRVKLAAGWLIEQSGFQKGVGEGNVGLSTKHALAIVAHAGATATEVVNFSRRIQTGVRERFGVALTPEPNFWGF
ncbi:MAG TPA: UDP-N-acetylmuramate dehydrogenase [Polyangiaceae bacterium]|nr:UDP-N-acetylmuramate dehydrogenase [Polyangiaceae bacterium]